MINEPTASVFILRQDWLGRLELNGTFMTNRAPPPSQAGFAVSAIRCGLSLPPVAAGLVAVFEAHYDRDDHGPDALMEPSEALLAWWTGHRQEVQDAFTAGA